ncbi:MAG: hypothetical protein ACI4J1_03220 [Ruminiclostridium sp.]
MKSKRFLLNGGILTALGIYLAVIFTVKSMWGIAQILILTLLAGLAAFQYILYFKFFKE